MYILSAGPIWTPQITGRRPSETGEWFHAIAAEFYPISYKKSQGYDLAVIKVHTVHAGRI